MVEELRTWLDPHGLRCLHIEALARLAKVPQYWPKLALFSLAACKIQEVSVADGGRGGHAHARSGGEMAGKRESIASSGRVALCVAVNHSVGNACPTVPN